MSGSQEKRKIVSQEKRKIVLDNSPDNKYNLTDV